MGGTRRLLLGKDSSRGAAILGGGVAGGAAAALLLVVAALLLFLVIRRRIQKKQRTSPADLRKFSYRELKSATGGFSAANKLGQGGFGSVFKGTIRGGLQVAVKRLDTASLQGEREFTNELAIMSTFSTMSMPPNVVALLGYCSDSKHRLLVYEFMANRSLQEALFGGGEATSVTISGGRRKLDWNKRIAVLLGVARALAFLHKCDPPIVHGDVKPSNVLLDGEMGAKLADFGLARVKTEIPENKSEAMGERDSMEREKIRSHRISRDKERRSERRRQSIVDVVVDDVVKTSSPPAVGSPSDGDCGANSSIPPTASPVAAAAAAAEDDDDWSKMSHQSASVSAFDATEAETWSKISPSEEIDCRSEDSSGQISGGGGKKRGKHWWLTTNHGSGAATTAPACGDGAATTSSGGSFREYMLEWVDRGRGKSRASDDNKKRQARSGSLEWWAECDDDGRELAKRIKSEEKRKKKMQQQQQPVPPTTESSREWWRGGGAATATVEHSGELTVSDESFTFYRHSGDLTEVRREDGRRRVRTRSRDWWSGEMQRGREWWSGELVASKKAGYSSGGGRFRQPSRSRSRSRSGEMWTTVSSTPSMRGTVCYVAPEYGGGGVMTEKSDVYSFGVLLLVVVSGRRPLQVLAAPLSEFERANLISWARHASHAGCPLDIVDSALGGDFSAQQAAMCVSLALLCLQRIPASRPSMAEVVKIISGEADLPALPFEFSPSPAKSCATTSNRRNRRDNNESAAPEFPLLTSSS